MPQTTTEHLKVGLNLPYCHLIESPDLWSLLTENFHAVTPARNFSVKQCYTKSDEPDFEITDWLCEKVKNSGLELHGHCLLHGDFAIGRWYDLSSFEVEKKLKKAIQEICDRYKGIVHEWEFLGEVVSAVGGLTNSFLRGKLGYDFPVKIFKWIREVDADVPLYYTDYGLESPNKLNAVLRFCEYLMTEKCDLTGIGIQFHHHNRGALNKTGIKRAIRSSQVLSLAVKLNEVTIWEDTAKLGGLSEKIQSHCYTSLMDLAVETKCKSFTFWAPFDFYAWAYPEKNPGLWDFNFVEKPVLSEVKRKIQKQA